MVLSLLDAWYRPDCTCSGLSGRYAIIGTLGQSYYVQIFTEKLLISQSCFQRISPVYLKLDSIVSDAQNMLIQDFNYL